MGKRAVRGSERPIGGSERPIRGSERPFVGSERPNGLGGQLLLTLQPTNIATCLPYYL